MTGSEIVTFRPGKDELYFEALKDMSEDGYFNGNFSQGIREALSAYTKGSEFPRDDFKLYATARALASENEDMRQELVDQAFFYRAAEDFMAYSDLEALEELGQLYQECCQ